MSRALTGLSKKSLIFFLMVFFMVSLTCRISPSRETPSEESPTATVVMETALQSPSAVPLPPAVVETRPADGGEINGVEGVIFYFNQPMKTDTVQAALVIEPYLKGIFEWLDNNRILRFQPDAPLPLATPIQFTLKTGALAENNLPLAGEQIFRFRTSEALKIVERIPEPASKDWDPSSAISVTFNQPVVSLDGGPFAFSPAFNLSPEVSGKGEWLNTNTYVFHPEPALFGGVMYTISVNPALVSASGISFSEDAIAELTWTFTTAQPEVIAFEPSGGQQRIDPDASFVIAFNQPMDTASVEQNLTLLGPGRIRIGGAFQWEDNASKVTFHPDRLLQRDTSYTLSVPEGTLSRGGTPMSKGFRREYRTAAPLSLVKMTPAPGKPLESGYNSVGLEFNVPLGMQNLENLIEVQPAIVDRKVSLSSDRKTVYVSGFYEPNLAYVITLAVEIQDRWGYPLAERQNRIVRVSPAEPSFTVPILQSGPPALFVLPEDPRLLARATNVGAVRISSASISFESFTALIKRYIERGALSMNMVPTQETRMHTLELEPNRNTVVEIPLAGEGESLKTGLYYFEFEIPELSANNRYLNGPFMGVVSRVNLTIKRNGNEMYIWAVNLQTLQPLSGAILTVYDDQNVPVATVTTDQNGLAWTSLPEGAQWRGVYYVLLGQPGDPDFGLGLTSWKTGLNGWELGIPVHLKPKASQPFTYLYTDRPIYHPGQTVYVRAILRQEENGRYFPDSNEEVTLQLFGEYNAETDERPLLSTFSAPISSYGTANGSFILPEDAQPGIYVLQTSDEPAASVTFRVVEYRKPEMELLVQFHSSEVQKGQDIQATVQANDYYGAPVGNLPIHWKLYAMQDDLNLPANLQSGAISAFWAEVPVSSYAAPGVVLTEGDARTDADGNLLLSFPATMLDQLIRDEGRQKLTLEVTAQNQSAYPVSNRASLIVHPANFYIGVRPESWKGQVGQEIGYIIQTVGWNREPSPAHALRGEFLRMSWKQPSPEEISIGAGQLVPEYFLVSSSDFKTDERGQARLTFTPPQPGVYMLEIKGDGAMTQVITWVEGDGEAIWPDLPDQRLILTRDAKSYRPGQTAHVLIPNPFGATALALVTMERGRVMHTPQSLIMDGSGFDLELVLGDEDAPNIFVSVVLLGKTAEGRPDFRVGYIEIPVEPSAYMLHMTLTPQPNRTMPGGEVSFKMNITDSSGKPVQGEFSLAIVDKAIFALTETNTPGITDAFYSPQPLGLETSLSLAGHARRMASGKERPESGETAVPLLVLRDKLADTAYWQAAIETDVNGEAEVSMKLPDHLTTWVAILRGLSKDTRVGEARAEVVTGKDLLVQPMTPAFLVSGDRVELAAIVQNNTRNDLTVEVSLQAAGFILDEPAQALQRITLTAGGKQRVSWRGTVQDTDQVELIFTAQSDNLQDVARPEQGKIPVLRYKVPQTLGVAGVLNESGERLETINLPRSFIPGGGQLRIELAPSLAASLLGDLKVLKYSPQDFIEPQLSALLSNVQTLRAFQILGADLPSLKSDLEAAVTSEQTSLIRSQNADGGWGWRAGAQSDPHTSAYAIYGLSLAAQSGFMVDSAIIQKAQDYLIAILQSQPPDSQDPDELAFMYYALRRSGNTDVFPEDLYELRGQMSNRGKSLLAMTLHDIDANDMRAVDLLSELKDSAQRSSTGVYWNAPVSDGDAWATSTLSTAAVTLALTDLEPQSPFLVDAVRYLVANRRLSGGWESSYETAWAILALTNVLKVSGDLSANYSFSASLNDVLVLNGQMSGDSFSTPISTNIPIGDLKPDEPNALRFLRDGEGGNLYYRAYLELYRPVESVDPLQNGILLSRQYYDSRCQLQSCSPIAQVNLSDHRPVVVRLTLTVPEAISYLVIEDYIPAGSEIINRQFGAASPGRASSPQEKGGRYFTPPVATADRIRWVAQNIPPGLYELTYELVPLHAGEFRVLPARAYAYYFPRVEGSSGGSLFTIQP